MYDEAYILTITYPSGLQIAAEVGWGDRSRIHDAFQAGGTLTCEVREFRISGGPGGMHMPFEPYSGWVSLRLADACCLISTNIQPLGQGVAPGGDVSNETSSVPS